VPALREILVYALLNFATLLHSRGLCPIRFHLGVKLRSLKEVEEIALAYRELCLPAAGRVVKLVTNTI